MQPVYRYDGTLDGLLCCVYEGYEKKESPLALLEPEDSSLLPPRDIETIGTRADRVRAGIIKSAGADALQLLEMAFLNGADPEKALWLERFIRLCFSAGREAVFLRGDETVAKAYALAQAATRESHLLKGFVRFTDYGTFLGAVIEPKHFALPLLQPHFCERYNAESFLIHDKTHGQVLLYQPYQWRIVPVTELQLPKADSDEAWLQGLWRGYYKAVTIQPRVNFKLYRQMLPLRFRPQMLETLPGPDSGNQLATPKETPGPCATGLPVRKTP